MIDDIIEKRREVLDLLFLVGVLSFITSLSSKLVAEANFQIQIFGLLLPIQVLLIFSLLIIFLSYLVRSPLFSLMEEQWISIPLGYDRNEESLLVPVGVGPGGSSVSKINRAWQNYHTSESDNSGQADPIREERTEVTFNDLLEYGVSQVLTHAFRSGWDIESHQMDRSIIRRTYEQPYLEMDAEALASAFSNNPLLEKEISSDGDAICFQVPPDTIITSEKRPSSDMGFNIVLENDYVRIQLQTVGRSEGHGYLPLKIGNLSKEINPFQNASDAEIQKFLKDPRRFSYANVNIVAVIKPKRRRILLPSANRHLRWAENIVNEIENFSEYPVEQVEPVNVER